MKKKIILIEDDKILSYVLRKVLMENGFEVFEAFDGEEGLALVKSEKPDLLILDILLPRISGLELVNKLKSDPETKDTPIIILSLVEKSKSVAVSPEAGEYEYIEKSDFKAVEKIVAKVKEKIGDPQISA